MDSVTVEDHGISKIKGTYTSSSPNTNFLYRCSEVPIDKLVESIKEGLSKSYIVSPTKSDNASYTPSTICECSDAVWRGRLHIDSLTKELEVLLANAEMSGNLKRTCAQFRNQMPGNPTDWSLIITLNSIFNQLPSKEPPIF